MGDTCVDLILHRNWDAAGNSLKIEGCELARGLHVEDVLEGHPVIVVILSAAVLVLFVVSLLGSFATSQRRKS